MSTIPKLKDFHIITPDGEERYVYAPDFISSVSCMITGNIAYDALISETAISMLTALQFNNEEIINIFEQIKALHNMDETKVNIINGIINRLKI